MTNELPDGRSLVRSLPCAVTDMIARLEDYGHQAVVVGGAVRSLLLGRTPTDWDVATSARPEQVTALFSRVHQTGAKYGTVTVIEGGMPIEVTTFRTDGDYTDSRRPDAVQFGHALEPDLARRDFTINAIAVDLRGQIMDPYGGQPDLQQRVVRAVGQPEVRFQEDALRLFRAVRLAAELGFSVEQQTRTAIHAQAAALARVARERHLQELRRLLLAPAAGWGLTQLRLTRLWPHIWPGNPLARAAPAAMARLPHDWELRLAACLVAGRKAVPVAAIAGLSQLRLPSRTMVRLKAIARAWPPLWPQEEAELAAVVTRHGRGLSEDLAWLAVASGHASAADLIALRQLLDSGRPLSVAELAITGTELINLGLPPGPAIGEALQQLLHAAARGNVPNDREALLDAAHNLQEFPAIEAKPRTALPQKRRGY